MCMEHRIQYTACGHLTTSVVGCQYRLSGGDYQPNYCSGPRRHSTLLINPRNKCPWCLVQDLLHAGQPVTDEQMAIQRPEDIQGEVVIPQNVESFQGPGYGRHISEVSSVAVPKKKSAFKRLFSKKDKKAAAARRNSSAKDEEKSCLVM